VTHVALACRGCSNDVNQGMDPGSLLQRRSFAFGIQRVSAPVFNKPKGHHAHTLSLGQQNDAIAANTVHATAPGIGLTQDGRLPPNHQHQLCFLELL